MYAIPAFLNDFNPANLSNPSSLQINSQPVAEGAGGRDEALEYKWHACPGSYDRCCFTELRHRSSAQTAEDIT